MQLEGSNEAGVLLAHWPPACPMRLCGRYCLQRAVVSEGRCREVGICSRGWQRPGLPGWPSVPLGAAPWCPSSQVFFFGVGLVKFTSFSHWQCLVGFCRWDIMLDAGSSFGFLIEKGFLNQRGNRVSLLGNMRLGFALSPSGICGWRIVPLVQCTPVTVQGRWRTRRNDVCFMLSSPGKFHRGQWEQYCCKLILVPTWPWLN